jgi:hypothetical protein
VCPGEGGVDVLEKYAGEVVAVVDRDQVDVLAQSFVEQVGPAECGPPEEDQVLTAVSAQRGKDVRDRVVPSHLSLGDAEGRHDLCEVIRL